MNPDINLTLIMIAAFIAAISPGPATLALAGTSMASGRRAGLALASGITTGSFVWSISAALGLGAVMLANAWAFEIVRYFGVGYLLFLAYKSARSALSSKDISLRSITGTPRRLYGSGLLLHVTNPKAVLFFGALFSIGVPAGTSLPDLGIVIMAVGLQSAIIFHLYAVVFSSAFMANLYLRARRVCEALFAVGFGAAGLKILTAKISQG